MLPLSKQRITIPKIMENEWFQKDYVPSCGNNSDDKIYLDDVNAAFDSTEVSSTIIALERKCYNHTFNTKNHICVNVVICSSQENDMETKIPKSASFINAFQLIAMSNDLDLSGLFEEEASPQ